MQSIKRNAGGQEEKKKKKTTKKKKMEERKKEREKERKKEREKERKKEVDADTKTLQHLPIKYSKKNAAKRNTQDLKDSSKLSSTQSPRKVQ